MKSILEQLHNAVQKTIEAAFKGTIARCEWEDPHQTDYVFQAPSIALKMDKIGPGKKDGSGRFPLNCSISAHCIIKSDERAHLTVKEMAAELMMVIYNHTFGLNADKELPSALLPENLDAEETKFDNESGFTTYQVRWDQTVFTEEETAPDVMVSSLFISQVPNIGPNHIDDYQEITNV